MQQHIASVIVMAIVLGVSPVSRAQDDPEDPRADVEGKVLAAKDAMTFPGVPAADQGRMKAQVERLWSILARNPAVNPPIGFDIRASLVANGILPRRGEPFIGRTSGLIHWYIWVGSLQRVERIAVADHAVVLITNHLSMPFSDTWQEDAEGVMYYEPREIRRVSGYPQYENGVVAVTDSPRPLWRPVPRERVLRRELDRTRQDLDSMKRTAVVASSYDPAANLEAWLRERPKRHEDLDRQLQPTRKSNPRLAEQMEKNFERTEASVEKVLRDLAARPNATAQPGQARQRAQLDATERCIATLEEELARLSAAERASPAYVALAGSAKLPRRRCSMTVDATFPNAIRIVEPNHDFFDTTLPRSAAQVVFVDFSSLHDKARDKAPRRRGRVDRVYDALRAGMDYAALAATLARR